MDYASQVKYIFSEHFFYCDEGRFDYITLYERIAKNRTREITLENVPNTNSEEQNGEVNVSLSEKRAVVAWKDGSLFVEEEGILPVEELAKLMRDNGFTINKA